MERNVTVLVVDPPWNFGSVQDSVMVPETTTKTTGALTPCWPSALMAAVNDLKFLPPVAMAGLMV
ncbi:MAG: hypothetical protein ACYTFN_11485 [Planctomycetota bacterium]|jgi:hypothetical protein